MKLINKIIFGTMSVNSKIHSIDVLKYALKNFKMFHLSSEYKSFNSVSKIIREKKKPN
jgi:hypothetical protein|tara:strand:- start:4 stop:177 length:174 start_codon:yes stop_codon:yes gene_type:complete